MLMCVFNKVLISKCHNSSMIVRKTAETTLIRDGAAVQPQTAPPPTQSAVSEAQIQSNPIQSNQPITAMSIK